MSSEASVSARFDFELDQSFATAGKDDSTVGTTAGNLTEKEKNRLVALAEKCEIGEDTVVETPKVAWGYINSQTGNLDVIGTMGNFSLIIGKAKSKKTRYLNIALSAAIIINNNTVLQKFKSDLPENQKNVLYFDTEQSRFHVKEARDRICRQAGVRNPSNLKVYGLRSLAPAERLELIEHIIYTTPNLGFVVIDGIKDLMRKGINDEEESIIISSKLLKWTEDLNIHIVTVLHQNKGNEHARGHIGTELMNKAETVLSVTLSDKDDTVSIVEAQFCRDKKPEEFAFRVGEDGLAEQVENYKDRGSNRASVEIEDYKKYQLLMAVFTGVDGLTYKPLEKALKDLSGEILGKTLGVNKISDLIAESKNKGWLTQEKPKAPYLIGEYVTLT